MVVVGKKGDDYIVRDPGGMLDYYKPTESTITSEVRQTKAVWYMGPIKSIQRYKIEKE